MTRRRRHYIIAQYSIIFYALAIYKWFNGMWLCQLHPSFFYTREDMVTWLFMRTGIHQWLLNNNGACILFDMAFYTAPLLLFAALRSGKMEFAAAPWMLVVNFIYVQCYTLYPTNSIEGHIAWLLFPVLFLFRNEKTFLLLLDGFRYFFLFTIVSAGLWKFLQGGIFQLNQMSSILLYQHKELITNSPGYWQTNLILYLIKHETISYLLYAVATLVELSFLIGFFTKKYDRYLLIAFIVFLCMDYFLMRIAYFEWMPLVILLQVRKKLVDKSHVLSSADIAFE